MPKAKGKEKSISQRARFIDAARELGCNDDKDAFEEKLKRVAKAKRTGSKPKHQMSKSR